MINDTLNSASKLQTALMVADMFLSAIPKDTPYQDFELRLAFSFFFFIKEAHNVVMLYQFHLQTQRVGF